jgi:hypothetical protein
MADLSPAAQAVLDAWGSVIRADNYGGRVEIPIAAALRAAADQLTRHNNQPETEFLQGLCSGATIARRELLAIAAELDNNSTH